MGKLCSRADTLRVVRPSAHGTVGNCPALIAPTSQRNPSMERAISFTLNGKPTRVTVDDERTLLWVLRSDLGLTGAKFGCGAALCGACTVIVNQEAVMSCTVPVKDIAGKHLLTIEGLSKNGKLHPLQEAFVNHNALQCGYCTSGMIMKAYALLLKNR